MATKLHYSVLILCLYCGAGHGWRAVPANEAMYARQGAYAGLDPDDPANEYLLPRTTLHSQYKFGYCDHQATNKKYLRSTLNVTFDDRLDTHGNFLYILADMATQRFRLQCVVIKLYTSKKFLFWKSRLPIYYCQGQLYILQMSTSQRLAVHEFFFDKKLDMAADLFFEFYHPDFL